MRARTALLLGLVVIGSCAPPGQLARKIEYRATGDGLLSVSYTNAEGGFEQMDVSAPWSLTFEQAPGAFLSMAVQAHGIQAIGCDILVDGKQYRHSASVGEAVIADCSARIP